MTDLPVNDAKKGKRRDLFANIPGLLWTKTDEGWKLRASSGAGLSNAIQLLAHVEPWPSVFRWDALRAALNTAQRPPCLDDSLPWREGQAWEEEDDRRLAAWAARVWRVSAEPSLWRYAALEVGLRQTVHPVQDYLQRVGNASPADGGWDAKPRLDTWLIDWWGAADTPYTRLVSRMFLLSAVARAMSPGEKVDTMLILEGLQGLRKSSGIQALFGPAWSTDGAVDWHSKDRFELLRGRWLVEVAELAGLGKADLDRVKGFVSTARDDYRRPYGKGTTEYARSCVFVGTVNPGVGGQYLRDEENRRFWPVRCHRRADLDMIRSVRDRVWAEAFIAWQGRVQVGGSEQWWPRPADEPLFAAEVADRRIEDPWTGAVAAYLDGELTKNFRREDYRITTAEILTEACKVEVAKHDRIQTSRIGAIMADIGWRNCGRVMLHGIGKVTQYGPPVKEASQ